MPIDSIPNILLRSKLAPEVVEKVKGSRMNRDAPGEPQLKLYSNALRALQDKFSGIQEEFQRNAAEHTSSLLADEIKTASGSATPSSSSSNKGEDMDAILENSIRWLYTGKQ